MNKFIYIILFLLLSCGSQNQNLEEELQLSNKIKNGKLDLSHMNLTSIPDLSRLQITEIDLSHNTIRIFNEALFPPTVKILDLSDNLIDKTVKINYLKLDNLNLSNNKIVKFYIDRSIINNLNLSNNKLELIQMPLYSSNELIADSLDISNNRKLSNWVSFIPNVYRYINRENIKNKKPLKFVLERPIH